MTSSAQRPMQAPVNAPFRARRMVLGGPLAERVAAQLSVSAPDLQTRVSSSAELTDADAAWADSYAGFTVPSNLGSASVRWVHVMAAGVDRVVPSLRDLPVVLTRTVGYMPRAIGLYVLTHLLADLHHLHRYRAQQHRGYWKGIRTRPTTGVRVAVLGAGEIGAGVATVLRANGHRVVGISSRGVPRQEFDEVVALSQADGVLAASDALVCALPLTDATRNLLDAEMFGRLHDALFVNVGRGACVDHDALRSALDAGQVRHAVLDVFETEPLPAEDWRWSHPRVTVTPHVSGRTAPDDVAESLTEARDLLAAGRVPPTAVDLGRGY